jgi:hypothetical protein
MSNNNQLPTTPGLQLPTQKGMLAGNPRDSAIASQTQTNTKQTSLINAVGGKRRKSGKKRGGADPNTDRVAVPQFQMQYQSTGGPGQDPNAVIQQNSQTSTQSTSNAVYDNYATQQGGSNKYTWGCFSGGKSGGFKRSNKRSLKRSLKRSKKSKRKREGNKRRQTHTKRRIYY